MKTEIIWEANKNITSKSFICGYCGESISSNLGFYAQLVVEQGQTIHNYAHIYICHSCKQPTYFDNDGNQYPGSTFGSKIQHITSQNVEDLYNESRNCIKVNAYTASIMCSRKLIMNIAVDKGADKNLKYIQYVDYLAKEGYVPPNSKQWVDSIRDKGNEANHEIEMMSEEDSKQLITFVEMILKFIYEYPGSIKKENNKEKSNT